ncbi:hypothetical protein BKA62DRAFT_796746 [Auriculariales sp. MPI-PUGE-AT-0066]|nr:hypothetical protein BKA62DRAFT_796746 [Auriculariales sp. MPI-PUGE-AT-0066]
MMMANLQANEFCRRRAVDTQSFSADRQAPHRELQLSAKGRILPAMLVRDHRFLSAVVERFLHRAATLCLVPNSHMMATAKTAPSPMINIRTLKKLRAQYHGCYLTNTAQRATVQNRPTSSRIPLLSETAPLDSRDSAVSAVNREALTSRLTSTGPCYGAAEHSYQTQPGSKTFGRRSWDTVRGCHVNNQDAPTAKDCSETIAIDIIAAGQS